MTENGIQRHLKAIFSADVKGYSKLMGDDDESTVNTITAYRKIISELIEKHQGRVVDSPGDNILAEFGSPLNAVNSAIAIQQRLGKENENLPADRRMQFRIGINLGDIIHRGDRIYGDGVNVAARIESLADPGGICISRNVFDQIKKKVRQGFEYMGEHSVKNISEPVRIYRLLLDKEFEGRVIGEPTTRSTHLTRSAAVAITGLLIAIVALLWTFYPRHSETGFDLEKQITDNFSDKVSIAVLPFDNMSNDPEQEYFSNGISENLITDLSKTHDFLVISRNSSFAFRGKPIDIKQIAKELDVRYVLEGSVQKANNRLRINAQLIDASSGHHIWADRYDGNIGDIFALQDKITQKIAVSLAGELSSDAQDRLAQQGTNNVEAYEAFLKGSDLANYLRMDPEGLAKSIPWFEKAVELDPSYGRAYAALSESYIRGSVGLLKRLGISPRVARMRAINYLEEAMKNPTDIAYRNLARIDIARRLFDTGVNHALKAISLDPNDADNNSVMALALINSGRPDEAAVFAERMRRTDPACLF